ncbi:unannotated protein [freshwater metagenome]|uniref:Unannotated protein n=1 Tax=freshwater metagenome TaxID=449393 RepID=A0A6J7KHK9_9ZZZZ
MAQQHLLELWLVGSWAVHGEQGGAGFRPGDLEPETLVVEPDRKWRQSLILRSEFGACSDRLQRTPKLRCVNLGICRFAREIGDDGFDIDEATVPERNSDRSGVSPDHDRGDFTGLHVHDELCRRFGGTDLRCHQDQTRRDENVEGLCVWLPDHSDGPMAVECVPPVLAPVPDETDEPGRPILMRSYTAQDAHDFEPFVEFDIDLNPERVFVGHHSASHLCAAARVTTRWRLQNDIAVPDRSDEDSVDPRWVRAKRSGPTRVWFLRVTFGHGSPRRADGVRDDAAPFASPRCRVPRGRH